MSGYSCAGCEVTFNQPGTVHGQPAALWALLEHQATEHKGDSDDA